MSLGYQLAYRIGFQPWERAAREGQQQLNRLLDREAQDRTAPLGHALDLGCGTGVHTIELARRGWQATGVDAVSRAIARARNRAYADRATFVVGDVTRLDEAGVDRDVEFFLDIGCFHGLDDQQRAAYGQGVTALAAPSATMLVLAFAPGKRPMLPAGADDEDLERALVDWKVLDAEAADTTGMPGPLKRTAPRFYRLQRVS